METAVVNRKRMSLSKHLGNSAFYEFGYLKVAESLALNLKTKTKELKTGIRCSNSARLECYIKGCCYGKG